MSKKRLWTLFITLMVTSLTVLETSAQQIKLVVRLAKLKIDSAQLEAYTAALKEEIETSIRVEPGVLTLNAVADKANLTHITILEIYADQEAYEQHLQTPHFKKFNTTNG